MGGFPVATRTIIRPFPLKLPPPRPRLLSCCYYWYYPHRQNFWILTLRVCWGGFWEYHAATPSSHAWSRLLDGASGSQDLRKPAAAPGVPGAGAFGAVLSFWLGGKGSRGTFCLAKATHFNGGDAGVDHHCAPGSDSMVGFSAISDYWADQEPRGANPNPQSC